MPLIDCYGAITVVHETNRELPSPPTLNPNGHKGCRRKFLGQHCHLFSSSTTQDFTRIYSSLGLGKGSRSLISLVQPVDVDCPRDHLRTPGFPQTQLRGPTFECSICFSAHFCRPGSLSFGAEKQSYRRRGRETPERLQAYHIRREHPHKSYRDLRGKGCPSLVLHPVSITLKLCLGGQG